MVEACFCFAKTNDGRFDSTVASQCGANFGERGKEKRENRWWTMSLGNQTAFLIGYESLISNAPSPVNDGKASFLLNVNVG